MRLYEILTEEELTEISKLSAASIAALLGAAPIAGSHLLTDPNEIESGYQDDSATTRMTDQMIDRSVHDTANQMWDRPLINGMTSKIVNGREVVYDRNGKVFAYKDASGQWKDGPAMKHGHPGKLGQH